MSTESVGYMLLFREGEAQKDLSPEQLQEFMNQWMGWFEDLSAQGKFKAGHPLKAGGKTVSGIDSPNVVDGPFAESREAIGGFFLLDVESMDEAVAIAKDCPNLPYGGSVEVREVADVCPNAEKLQEAQTEAAVA